MEWLPRVGVEGEYSSSSSIETSFVSAAVPCFFAFHIPMLWLFFSRSFSPERI